MDILGSVPTHLCEKQPSVRRSMSRSLSFSCHDQYLNGTATSLIMSLYGIKLYISSMMLKNCCWRGEERTALSPLTFTFQLFAINTHADSELLFAWFGRGAHQTPPLPLFQPAGHAHVLPKSSKNHTAPTARSTCTSTLYYCH